MLAFHPPQFGTKDIIHKGHCAEYAPQDTFSGMGGVFFTRGIFAQLKNPPPKIYLITVDKYIRVRVDKYIRLNTAKYILVSITKTLKMYV